MSNNHEHFYINGTWVKPLAAKTIDVINPATERAYTKISMGSSADVDRAVAAAKAAFPAFSRTSREERSGYLRKILEIYNSRCDEIAEAVSDEMGAPLTFAREAQVWAGRVHLESTIKALEEFEYSSQRGSLASSERRSASWASSLRGTGRSIRSSAKSLRRLRRGAPWCSSQAKSRPSAASCSPRSCTRRACRKAYSIWSAATVRLWEKPLPHIRISR